MSLINRVTDNSFLRKYLINEIKGQESRLNTLIPDILTEVIETLLEIERDVFLGSDERINKKNGYYSRMAKTLSGVIELSIPRDRIGVFKPLILQVIKREKGYLDELALSLYTKGMSNRDINDVLKKAYGIKTSPQYVSDISSRYSKLKEDWDNRKLDSNYYVIYIDAIHMNIRRSGSVENEAVYVAMGLKLDFTKEILGIYSIPEESADGWRSVLQDLKKRGVKQIISFTADGLTGLDTVIKEEYPNSLFQRCIVHLMRNIYKKVRVSDRTEIIQDMKNVFNVTDKNDTVIEGMKRFDEFREKWKKSYPSIDKMEDNEHYFTYLLMPFQIRKLMYTSNPIERLNKEFRKVIKNKNSFPNPASALMLIWLKALEVMDRRYRYQVNSLLCIKEELDSMFK
ncbi:MAG: IS256 family transposase [Minisyncoccus archaeiphilus]|uniref:IS256 family transposase n=1 Tax=Minisyncoccus archaeiphilus TaxID=3238481 RepID=UPI002B124133|nr:MAG: IS256 family transposase [Candidatus Parcubacteria bacterium]